MNKLLIIISLMSLCACSSPKLKEVSMVPRTVKVKTVKVKPCLVQNH